MTRRQLNTLTLGLVLALTAMTAACGGESSGADLAAWCDQMAELDEQEELPDHDQFQVLVDTAPDEIAGDVEAAVAILRRDGEEAFGSPELEPHLDAVFGFRDNECA